ncbi:MAG: hypothetical protein U1F26_03305 [Lysobacterales bacterium]
MKRYMSRSRTGGKNWGVTEGFIRPVGHLLPEGEGLKDRIGALAEQLDAHRKRQQAAHAELTLTGMYNVLEKLKAGRGAEREGKADPRARAGLGAPVA